MKDTIKSMLLENTGKHFLDSGWRQRSPLATQPTA